MLLLALDTSTPAVTVALHDGERVVAESTTVDARRHTELLAPAITRALTTAGADRRDITEISVGVGPGPFTGLRVGVTAACTLGVALGVPVRGVCSLDIMAYRVVTDRAQAGRPFLVASDARRREVFWASYDASGRRSVGPDVGAAADITTTLAAASGDVASAGGAALRGGDVWAMAAGAASAGLDAIARTGGDDVWQLATRAAAGAGARLYPVAFGAVLEPEYPSAADLAVATLEGAVQVLDPQPLYLRRPDATPPTGRKRVLTS